MDEDFGSGGMDEDISSLGMSTCDDCSIGGASIHLTHVENGEVQTYHLCENCAQKRGIPLPGNGASILGFSPVNIGNMGMLGGIGDAKVKLTFNQPSPSMQSAQVKNKNKVMSIADAILELADATDIKCRACGMTRSDLRQGMRLGCPKCYESFGQDIEKMLMHMHGNKKHAGKSYISNAAPRVSRQEIERLRGDLDCAVKEERFEDAAQIRDAIKHARQRIS